MGGDVIKIYYSSRLSQKKVESISAVLADRLFGVYALFLIAAIALFFWVSQLENRHIAWIVWGILLLATFGMLFAARLLRITQEILRRIGYDEFSSKINSLLAIVDEYGKQKLITSQAIGISLLTKLLSVITVSFLSKSISINISISTLLWLVPIVFAVSMLPSLNGLGIREGTFVYFLGPIVGRENAFALSILWLAVFMISDVIGGLIYAFSNDFRRSLPKEK